MGTSALIVALTAFTSAGASIPEKQVEKQEAVFSQLWGTDFQWNFAELPTKGAVPRFRVPYSGHIYPDTAGGTVNALSKYDRAFNRGRYSATSHERWDTTAFKEPARGGGRGFGLFGGRGLFAPRMQTPYWHGHCNGWTAAAIRHAEPQKSVSRNGVVFTPADIKALLAEIYIYNDHTLLAGSDYALNAGEFHAVMANWIGRGKHPIAMEADPSEEKWNYPIYSFASSSAKRRNNQVEVKMNIAYAKDSSGEYQQSPRIRRIKYFHYMLDLDDGGKIVGGYFFRSSSFIEMLWVPLRPKASRATGNERGNPYVNVDTVLAIWRDSVSEEERKRWLVVDPAEEDAIVELNLEEENQLTPPHADEPPAAADAVASAEPQSTDDASAGNGAIETAPTENESDTVSTESTTPVAAAELSLEGPELVAD